MSNINGLVSSTDVAGSGNTESNFFIRKNNPVIVDTILANEVITDLLVLGEGILTTEDGELFLDGSPVSGGDVDIINGIAPIIITGTNTDVIISLENSTVVPGTYTVAEVTINSKGLITNAVSGVIPLNSDWSNFPAQTTINANSFGIENLLTPTKIGDATNKSYVDGLDITNVKLSSDQSISGIKTFTTLPESSVVPTTPNQIVNKNYTDSLDVTNVKLTGVQSISGIKTFTTLPESSVVPTTPNQLVNKAYIDAIPVPPVPTLSDVLTSGNTASKDINMAGFDISSVNDITMGGLVPSITATNVLGNLAITSAATLNLGTAGQMTLASGGILSLGGATYTSIENVNINNSVISKETGMADLSLNNIATINNSNHMAITAPTLSINTPYQVSSFNVGGSVLMIALDPVDRINIQTSGGGIEFDTFGGDDMLYQVTGNIIETFNNNDNNKYHYITDNNPALPPTLGISALLELDSIDKGLYIPRMTSVQRLAIGNNNADVQNGLLVYDTTVGSVAMYGPRGWAKMTLSDISGNILDDIGGLENGIPARNLTGFSNITTNTLTVSDIAPLGFPIETDIGITGNLVFPGSVRIKNNAEAQGGDFILDSIPVAPAGLVNTTVLYDAPTKRLFYRETEILEAGSNISIDNSAINLDVTSDIVMNGNNITGLAGIVGNDGLLSITPGTSGSVFIRGINNNGIFIDETAIQITSNLSANFNRITQLPPPVASTDAVNKSYVDSISLPTTENVSSGDTLSATTNESVISTPGSYTLANGVYSGQTKTVTILPSVPFQTERYFPGDGNFSNGSVVLCGEYDAINDVLYFGGTFQRTPDGFLRPRIAMFSQQTNEFYSLNLPGGFPGLTNGQVTAMFLDGNRLYVGGDFSNVTSITGFNRIAYWEITGLGTGNWNVLSTTVFPINFSVNSITRSGAFIYIGGSFSSMVGISGTGAHIIRYNPATGIYSGVSSGFTNTGRVNSVFADSNRVYIGGQFTNAVGSSSDSSNICVFNTTSGQIETLGDGIPFESGQVFSITKYLNTIVACGTFQTTQQGNGDFVQTPRIARWDLSTSFWSAIGDGFVNQASAIKVLHGRLYCVGQMTGPSSGSVFYRRACVYNDALDKWDNFSGTQGTINDLFALGDNVLIIGNFGTLYGNMTQNIIIGAALAIVNNETLLIGNNNLVANGVPVSSIFMTGNISPQSVRLVWNQNSEKWIVSDLSDFLLNP